MKHCIIVRWIAGTDMDALLPDIRAIFEGAKAIPGVRGIRFVPGVNRRGSGYENRYDLMIEMTMDAASLPAYNESGAHREWKRRYGALIESKCIFDYD